ncbi:MAG: sigma-54-dependent Fis family transcriptional regulator [Deltaproteobacteria bacterium]|nr:sigma-54-dependent Fis family transcriptional regulator [Deltaproteobacteria bacterium]
MAMAILFIDDDDTGRDVAVYNLRKAGLEVDDAANGAAGLARFDPDRHQVVITDLKMPEVDGMQVLERVHTLAPEVPVVVITAFGSIDRAVAAMRRGAWDFVEKPFSRDQLELTARRALEASRLRRDNRRLRVQAVERPIHADSAAMKEVLDLVDRVAPTDATVMVTGESGVGKELVARRLHARSLRATGPFVALSCSTIPTELLEAELFGHAKGAFTGAIRAREGRFRKASGGTLFLDEIGEMAADLQVKLLRVLQEGVVDPVGADEPVTVDVRIIAATNRRLDEMVAEGTFREDLYYRLNVIRIEVPPLRERREDIGVLARAFLAEFGGGRELVLPNEVEAALLERPWRGNVRELRNVCERLAILCPGDRVRLEDFPRDAIPQGASRWLDLLPEGISLIDLEAQVIQHTLDRYRGNVTHAAQALGVPRHVLAYRIEKYGLKREGRHP